MQATFRRKSDLPCLVGLHKRGPVCEVDGQFYSECFGCGGDLIRARNRWRAPRPHELPATWKAQRRPPPSRSAYAALVTGLAAVLAVLAAAIFHISA